MTTDDRPAVVQASGREQPDRARFCGPDTAYRGACRVRLQLGRLLTLFLPVGPGRAKLPRDGDCGLGVCRWCLTIVTRRSRRSAGWVHLATGHATCLEPPMGAPLTCTAQPLPPAPQRWDVLFPADHRRARIAWTLGIIGAANPNAPAPAVNHRSHDAPVDPRRQGPSQ